MVMAVNFEFLIMGQVRKGFRHWKCEYVIILPKFKKTKKNKKCLVFCNLTFMLANTV